MKTNIILAGLLVLLVTTSCKDKGGGGGGERQELAIGTSGFVVSVPQGAEIKTDMPGFYSIKGGGIRGLQLRESSMGAPASADELATEVCAGQGDLVKETLPTGGFYVQCKGPSKAIEGSTTSKVVSSVPAGGDKTLRCQTETDQDPSAAAAICRSLHKK